MAFNLSPPECHLNGGALLGSPCHTENVNSRKAAHMEKMLKVIATKVGHYDSRVREVGDIFEVPASFMTARRDDHGKVTPPTWFEPVEEREVVTKSYVRKAQAQPSDDDLI